MVPDMRGLSPGLAQGSPEPGTPSPRSRHVLALPSDEAWRPPACALLEAEASDPASVSAQDSCFPGPEGLGWEGATEAGPFLPVSPEVMKRRRGGLIEQRDIVKAHEAHKLQSTPQARRKEWE